MNRMKVLGVVLAGLFALFAASAVSASATPEWGACLKAEPKNTGTFSDKTCSATSEPGKGKYELVAGSVGKGKRFKVKGIGNQTLHIVVPGVRDVPITCKKLKGSGQPVAPNAEKEITLEFQKCTTLEGEVPCENVARETIKTNALSGVLAEVEGKVGTILSSEGGPYLAELVCPGVFHIPTRLLGEVFGEYTGATNAISKVSFGQYTVGPYLGEPEPGYTPLVNPPTAGPPDYGVLYTEGKRPESECDEINPEDCKFFRLPSGLEGQLEVRGEALMIKT
jgi:hypothetical protein